MCGTVVAPPELRKESARDQKLAQTVNRFGRPEYGSLGVGDIAYQWAFRFGDENTLATAFGVISLSISSPLRPQISSQNQVKC